ncbi:PRC-barrel domain-containing protein [Bradyrhizobium japonicum]
MATITALLFASAAFAQTPAHTASEAAAPIAAAGDWSAAKMKGVNVYNEANDKVGDVYDIIIDSQGRVRGLVIEAGGFWEWARIMCWSR